MTETKTFPVPEELKELMIEYHAAQGCRDKCISSLFKAKKAIYYGKQAYKAQRKFLDKARKIYPEINNGRWIFNDKDNMITEPL